MSKIALRQLALGAILCFSFYAFTQLAAVYFYVWAFEDFVTNEVKFTPFRNPAAVGVLPLNILDAARYYNLQLDPKEIKVSRTVTIPGMTWSTLGVDVAYTANLDFIVFKRPLRVPLHFHTRASVEY
jgi:hypothetical protein